MWKGLRVPLQSSVPSALIWLRPDWAGPEKDSGNPAPQGFAAGFSRSDGRPAYRTGTGGIRQTHFPERKLPAGAATKSVNRKYAKRTETSMCPQCSTGLFPGLGDRTGISYRTFMENFDYLRKQWCFGHLEMSPRPRTVSSAETSRFYRRRFTGRSDFSMGDFDAFFSLPLTTSGDFTRDPPAFPMGSLEVCC